MRPKNLPEYNKPPLQEVVLGVQFDSVKGYRSTDSFKIWNLFKEEFPKLEEHHLRLPQFETFGGLNPSQSSPQFQINSAPIGSRLWFVSEDESHILQFQPDCLLTNWRKRKDSNIYPRFEGVSEAFNDNLNTLAAHFKSNFDCEIEINQSEVTYVNIVPVEKFSEASEWFKIWGGIDKDISSLSMQFSEEIANSEGQRFARLIHDLSAVTTEDGQVKAFRLSLTFRGKPAGNDIASAMVFMNEGRDHIVDRFDTITTAKAHGHWDKNNE